MNNKLILIIAAVSITLNLILGIAFIARGVSLNSINEKSEVMEVKIVKQEKLLTDQQDKYDKLQVEITTQAKNNESIIKDLARVNSSNQSLKLKNSALIKDANSKIKTINSMYVKEHTAHNLTKRILAQLKKQLKLAKKELAK